MEFINARDLPLSGPMAENHGIIVLQDGKLRYMSLAEFQNYMASASIDTDDTLTVGGVAADAAATGAAIKNARPSNLLDNTDFRNPINTTGFSGGAPSADNVFFIDKWKTQQNATKNIEIDFSDSGLTIHVSTGLAGIAQVIPKPKTGVTFAAKVNGKIESVYSVPGVDGSVKTAENVLLYVEWLEDTLQLIIRNTGDEANEYTIEWAALYEGEYTADNLPTYQPRGYSVEAAVCGAAGGGASMELLWENASPDSGFAEHSGANKLKIDWSGYVKYAVEYRTEYSFYATMEAAVGKNMAIFYHKTENNNAGCRSIVFESDGLSIYGAFFNGSANNSYCVPWRIYGIKGVSA